MSDNPDLIADTVAVKLPPKEDVRQAVEAIAYWLDQNTWIDLHDDEAYVIEMIEQGALLLKWAPDSLKRKLIESWGYEVLGEHSDGSGCAE